MIHRLITTWNKTNLMKRSQSELYLGVVLTCISESNWDWTPKESSSLEGLRAIAPYSLYTRHKCSLPTCKKEQRPI